MIGKISLENFKSFSSLDNLDIKPITILCGTNSCGKSSILQSILLLKQTIECQNTNQTLLLNGRFVHLGVFDNVVFQKDSENALTFDINFSIKGTDTFQLKSQPSFPISFIIEDLFDLEIYYRSKAHKNKEYKHSIDHNTEYHFHYRISLKNLENRSGKHSLKPLIVESIIFDSNAQINNDIVMGVSFDMNLKDGDKDIYDVTWKNAQFRRYYEKGNKSGKVTAHIEFANFLPISINALNNIDEHSNNSPLPLIFNRLNFVFQGLFSTYRYIGPLREEPSRRYIYEDEIIEIGVKGENAAYIYLSEQDKNITNHFFYDIQNDSFIQKQNPKLSEAVEYWFDLMNIKGFKPEPSNEIIYLNLNSNSSANTRVNIADVGFGVSQIFPIVLEGLRMPIRNTLLLEQPEIHLHPKVQMQMADYFISLALSDKKVIAETHSDHIINRLVRRIVEDESGNLSKMIGIYFIKATPNGAIFEEVNIDDCKGITNWPVDFFDQVATEQEKIMLAGLKKRKALKAKENNL